MLVMVAGVALMVTVSVVVGMIVWIGGMGVVFSAGGGGGFIGGGA
jgi:hypothetical protein